jgi:hypothetical protein
VYLAHSRTPKAVKRAHRFNMAEKVLSGIVSAAIVWSTITVVTYIMMSSGPSLLSTEQNDLLGDMLRVLLVILGLGIVVSLTTLAIRGTMKGDIEQHLTLEPDSVVLKIRRDASPGEYSEDSLFELQEGHNAFTKAWKARH